MKEFRRPSGQGGDRNKTSERGGYGNHKGDFNAGERREIKHKATCSECNNTCEVPFRPNGSKPVYCKDCFGKKKGGQGAGNYEKREFAPRAPAPREERAMAPARDTRIDDLKAQMDSMQSKLDRILKTMESNKVSEVAVKETAVASVKKPAVKKAVSVKKPVKPTIKKKK